MVTMRASGANCADIRSIFGGALSRYATELNSGILSKGSVFKVAEQFLELLLFFEEQKAFFDTNSLIGPTYDRIHH